MSDPQGEPVIAPSPRGEQAPGEQAGSGLLAFAQGGHKGALKGTLTLLAVHAHPDDETICTGGTLARYAAEGARTVLVCCTRGEEGKIYDPRYDAVRDKPRLGEIREAELRRAAEILGIDAVCVLPYRDSGMAGRPANAHPGNFMNADPEDAAERVAAIIRAERPHVAVTYDGRGGYGHPDHLMAHRMTLRAIERAAEDGPGGLGWSVAKLYYTAIRRSALELANRLMRERGLPAPFDEDDPTPLIRQMVVRDADVTALVDVRAYRDRARAALRAHRTQIREDDVLLALPDDIATEAFAAESYIRAWTRVAAPAREDDLFAGLRP